MKQFVWGILTTTCLATALFFWRYWKASGDRLFVFFSLAFTAMAANWIGLALVDPALELEHYVLLFRLVAFAFIIVGIVDKNRRGSRL